MIDVEPKDAKIGDLVELDHGITGVVVGVSSQNDCLLINWSRAHSIDVVGFNSPLWYGSTVFRKGLTFPWEQDLGT